MRQLENTHWLAGLLEGEGTFRNNGCSASVEVGMTDRDVIERAVHVLGAKEIKTYPGTNKPTYRATVFGAPAISWMFALYGHMGARRQKQIRNAVERWKETRRPTSMMG